MNPQVAYRIGEKNAKKYDLYLCDVGRIYSNLNFNKANWVDIQADLKEINWCEMKSLSETSPEEALTYFNDKVLTILEKYIPKKRSKIEKKRTLIWRRLSKLN